MGPPAPASAGANPSPSPSMPATTATRRRSATRPRILGESAAGLFDVELAAAGAMHPRIVAELEAARDRSD